METLEILTKLKAVSRTGDGWKARCPAHDDEHPSLSVKVADDGRVLVYCFAGCTVDAILGKLGMRTEDLAPHADTVVTYPYHDEDGALLYEVVRSAAKRFRLRRPLPDGGWTWRVGDVRRVPYRLPHLRGEKRIVLVEGEKDADKLVALGLPATTTPQGANAWRDEYAEDFRTAGAEEIVIIPDNDDPGRRYAFQAGTALTARGIAVRVVTLPGVAEKGDVSDWLEAGGSIDELKALMDEAPTFEEWRASDDVRPVVDMRDGNWRRIVEDSYIAIVDTNTRGGGPHIYVGPDNLVRVVRRMTDRPSVMQVETDDTLRGYLMRNVTFLAEGRNGAKSVVPPPTVVRDILTRPTWTGLPELRGIIETPVLSTDGRVVTTSGYQPENRLWYAPASGFEVPAIPESPSDDDVARAMALLIEVIADFPFDSTASRANALALMLLPFVREFIAGPTPLHLIDAPTPGSGKGLLADCCSILATGREAAKGPAPRDAEETRKHITARLVAGASMVVLDNVINHLDSAPLASVLTTEVWEDRLLGVSRQVRPLNRAVWIVTGNNVSLSRELARRTVWIRLEPDQERPELRRGFRHPQLIRWVREQRGVLVAACLTLARAWVVKGQPAGAAVLELTFGSFESWLDVIGGVLSVAGVKGLLDNRDTLNGQGDDELYPLTLFMMLWRDAAQATPRLQEANAQELLPIARNANLDVGDGGEMSQLQKLGRVLSHMEGRVIGSMRLRSRLLNGKKAYKLTTVGQ